ncbi:hypothetical protein [Enterococcus sp. AZ103]|uniref:hypothetical protein n=1 Tax=Enterococcus sp. AZ103 TaxID=2774628 RepID=UPI003F220021
MDQITLEEKKNWLEILQEIRKSESVIIQQHTTTKEEVKQLESILNLMKQIKDGFPYLSLEQLKKVILRKMATREIVVAFLENTVVGLMIVDLKASSIELLDSLPTLWEWDIERLLLDFARENFLFTSNFLSITSFREKDKLDIGRRERLLRLNFIPTKKSVNFSYPTEDFLLKLP